MSFLTESDVNKRAFNLFIAHSSAQPELLLSITKNAAPQFLAQYQAVVPGATFDGAAFDPSTAGNNVTLLASDYEASFNHVQDFGSVLGLTSIALNSSVAWELVVNSYPPTLITATVGGWNETFEPYDPNLPFEPIAAYQDDVQTSICNITSPGDPSTLVPILQFGDVIGVVVGSAAREVFFFRNGVLEDSRHLAIATVAVFPGVTAVFPV